MAFKIRSAVSVSPKACVLCAPDSLWVHVSVVCVDLWSRSCLLVFPPCILVSCVLLVHACIFHGMPYLRFVHYLLKYFQAYSDVLLYQRRFFPLLLPDDWVSNDRNLLNSIPKLEIRWATHMKQTPGCCVFKPVRTDFFPFHSCFCIAAFGFPILGVEWFTQAPTHGEP